MTPTDAQEARRSSRWRAAIRTGTASTEAILSRFTRAASHPAYQAMLEIGCAQKTILVSLPARPRPAARDRVLGDAPHVDGRRGPRHSR